jgi:hypothetical protein
MMMCLSDLVNLVAMFFAGNQYSILDILAGIFVVGSLTKGPPSDDNSDRPEWIKDDGPNGIEWRKVKRYSELAVGMYTWKKYLYRSLRAPLVCKFGRENCA